METTCKVASMQILLSEAVGIEDARGFREHEGRLTFFGVPKLLTRLDDKMSEFVALCCKASGAAEGLWALRSFGLGAFWRIPEVVG